MNKKDYKLQKVILNDFYKLMTQKQKLEVLTSQPVLIGMIDKLDQKIQIKISKILIIHHPYLLSNNSKVKTKITDKKALEIINIIKTKYYKKILKMEKDIVKACIKYPHFLYYIGDFLSIKEKNEIIKEVPECLVAFYRVSKELQRIAAINIKDEYSFMNGSFNKINDPIALTLLMNKVKNIESKEKIRKHRNYKDDASLILKAFKE